MKYKNVIVLRTHFFSQRWHDILIKLSPAYYVVVVIDGRVQELRYDDFKVVKFNVPNVSSLELKTANDMQWRFGDYALYLAHNALKNDNITYDYMWLVEPDVYMRAPFSEMISSCAENSYDLLTSYFGVAGPDWMWCKYRHELSSKNVYMTFFPFMRLSNRLVTDLISERIKLNTMANDESFVGTFVGNNNYSVNLFSSYSEVNYSRNSFSYRLPHYLPFIKKRIMPKYNLFHPCFDTFGDYLNHIIKKGSWKNILKRFFFIENKD